MAGWCKIEDHVIINLPYLHIRGSQANYQGQTWAFVLEIIPEKIKGAKPKRKNSKTPWTEPIIEAHVGL